MLASSSHAHRAPVECAGVPRQGQSVLLDSYLAEFASLFGDGRSRALFGAVIQGILTSGSLVCSRIAAQAPLLSKVKHGSQRVLRFAAGESIKRSSLKGTTTAKRLVDKLAQRGVASLKETPTGTEVWLVLDGSDLRKPYAKDMPDLMRVRTLQGGMCNGYCTVNVLGITPQQRTLLYHHLYSSKEKGHLSKSYEVQRALEEVGTELAPIGQEHPVTWIMDSDFDDEAVWRTIWEHDQHMLCRAKHIDRLIRYLVQPPSQYNETQVNASLNGSASASASASGLWQEGHLEDAARHLKGQGRVQTSMVVRLRGQRYEKRQPVTVELSSCPIEVSYEPDVRRVGARKGKDEKVTRTIWLLRVEVMDSYMKPWYLLTDWSCATHAQAARIFQMYRQRWAVEEAFQFLKMCVGWESVQVLDLEGVRTLVALGWVAAGFLYEIDGGWEWVDVELLARLGGFEPHKGRKPGKKVLLWGLQRVLDYMVTTALLRQHKAATGSIPPAVASLLGPDALTHL